MKLATRVGRIQPSPTLAITNKAKQMKAQGIDVVGFGAGEPDFDTPDHIKAVAKKALDDGYTKYTPVPGSPELKDAIIAKLKRDNGLEYKRENIIVSLGRSTRSSTSPARSSRRGRGGHPAPYWGLVPGHRAPGGRDAGDRGGEAIHRLQDHPRTTGEGDHEEDEALRAEQPLESHGRRLLEGRARGAGPGDREEGHRRPVGRDLREAGVRRLSGSSPSPPWGEEIKKRTILVKRAVQVALDDGVAHRLRGGGQGPRGGDEQHPEPEHEQPGVVLRQGVHRGAHGSQEFQKAWVAEFDRRAPFIVERLNRMPACRACCPRERSTSSRTSPAATGRRLRPGRRSTTPRTSRAYLLDEHNVASVPRRRLRDDACQRLSYAMSMKNIEKGIDRIEQAVKSLK